MRRAALIRWTPIWIKALVVATLLTAAFGIRPAHPAGLFPSTYDAPIQKAVTQYWPGLDWRLLKSQLWQESHLDPAARSGVGAEGLAQFMSPTWSDVSIKLGYGGYPRTAVEPAIEGAAYYMASLKRYWPQAVSRTNTTLDWPAITQGPEIF